MFTYIVGTITEINAENITVENNGIGYAITVANPYAYKISDNLKIYIYQHLKENENTLYGFKKQNQKDLFLDLISVKGIGPKTAIIILTATTVEQFKAAIVNKDIDYLSKFPKVGSKSVSQMILDLEKKYDSNLSVAKDSNEDLINALEALGYKRQQITKLIPKINKDNKLEMQIKEALNLLLNI